MRSAKPVAACTCSCTPRWRGTASASMGCPWPCTRTPGRRPTPSAHDCAPGPSGMTIEGDRLATIELAAVERAATIVVRGAPDQFDDAFRALHEWVDRSGDQATSFDRELYVDCDGPRDTWVTELQTILRTRT